MSNVNGVNNDARQIALKEFGDAEDGLASHGATKDGLMTPKEAMDTLGLSEKDATDLATTQKEGATDGSKYISSEQFADYMESAGPKLAFELPEVKLITPEQRQADQEQLASVFKLPEVHLSTAQLIDSRIDR